MISSGNKSDTAQQCKEENIILYDNGQVQNKKEQNLNTMSHSGNPRSILTTQRNKCLKFPLYASGHLIQSSLR